MKHIITIAIIAVTTTASDVQAQQSGILGGIQQIVGNFGYSSSSNACARRSSAACSQQSACSQRAQSACSQQAYQSACSQRAMSACSVQSACAQQVQPACSVQAACSQQFTAPASNCSFTNKAVPRGLAVNTGELISPTVLGSGRSTRPAAVPQPRPVPQTVVKQRQPVRQSTRGGGGFTG